MIAFGYINAPLTAETEGGFFTEVFEYGRATEIQDARKHEDDEPRSEGVGADHDQYAGAGALQRR